MRTALRDLSEDVFFRSPAGIEVKDREQSYPELWPQRGSVLVGWTGCCWQHKAALG